jgi:hypothetical protein
MDLEIFEENTTMLPLILDSPMFPFLICVLPYVIDSVYRLKKPKIFKFNLPSVLLIPNLAENIYKIQDWVTKEYWTTETYYWIMLSSNPHPYAIELLKKNPKKIDPLGLSMNPHPWAIEVWKLNKNMLDGLDGLNFNFLNFNSNPWMIDYLKENPKRIYTSYLVANPHPWAIEQVKDVIYNDKKWGLYQNPNTEVIEMVFQYFHPAYIDCPTSFCNPNPKVVEYWKSLGMYDTTWPDMDWGYMFKNPHPEAIKIVKENSQKFESLYNNIHTGEIFSNPAIFELDYEKIRIRKLELHQELMRVYLHPSRIKKWIDSGMELEDYP